MNSATNCNITNKNDINNSNNDDNNNNNNLGIVG